ncbi:MAG: flagellar basal-body MS-ring/collar protein FliF, partial [Woeseiaceae bacterium]
MDKTSIIDGTATPARQLSLGGVLRIPAVRQVLLLIGVAASVAGGFAVVLWSQTPAYTELYSELEGNDTAQVAEALRAADIDFRLSKDTGSVSVPAARLHDARLEFASQGLPQGTSGGMEMLQGQSSFGVSQFMESARYQHALESELARTISHLGAVEDARVHLA